VAEAEESIQRQEQQQIPAGMTTRKTSAEAREVQQQRQKQVQQQILRLW
jgi:hypothetical protein